CGRFFFFFQAEDGIRDFHVTGVQTCALPILDRCEPDPWVEGWTGGPADQSEVDGVVDRSGVVAQASMSGLNTGPVDRVEARAESGGLVRSTARAGVVDRAGPGSSCGVGDRPGGPGE